MHEVCDVSVYSQPSQWIRKGLPCEQLEWPFYFFQGGPFRSSYWDGGGGGVGVKYKKIFIPGKINKRNRGNVNK